MLPSRVTYHFLKKSSDISGILHHATGSHPESHSEQQLHLTYGISIMH
jgi:hypothetical protein